MDHLPNEIMIKILSYLPTIDLLQFIKAYEDYSNFLREKHVIQFLNFKNLFELSNIIDLCQFISTNVACNYIKVLNIGGLYWIPVQDIRKLISQLDMLEELYAIDTKLGAAMKDISLYGKLNILAISIEASQLDNMTSNIYFNSLNGLQKLCVKLYLKKDNFEEMYWLFGALKQLTELWIYDNDEQFGINYERIVAYLPNLYKLVIKSRRPVPVLDFSCWGLNKIYQSQRYNSAVETVFERVPLVDMAEYSISCPQQEQPIEKAWKVLQCLHCEMPCGPKDCKKIYLKQDIKDIEFEDLNFCQAVKLCNSKYINAALQILSSKNSTNLKRLSFRSCLFQSPQLKPRVSMTTGFKRLRSGIQFNSTDHPFKNIAHNIRKLRELEVVTCSSCSGGTKMSAYHLIDTFEGLQKLTLEIPIILDGSFLKEVFTKCRYLQSLNLNCLGHNEKFIINLCRNLQYANELRDFRLEHKEIAIDKLLNSFNTIVSKKLLRIFIKCDSLRNSNDEVFSDCLGKNPQLIFFYLIVSNNSINSLGIRKILSSYKKGHPAKNFFVVRDASTFNGVFPIPAAHHDMIFPRTNVSVINLDDF